jgi:hypothetical protein
MPRRAYLRRPSTGCGQTGRLGLFAAIVLCGSLKASGFRRPAFVIKNFLLTFVVGHGNPVAALKIGDALFGPFAVFCLRFGDSFFVRFPFGGHFFFSLLFLGFQLRVFARYGGCVAVLFGPRRPGSGPVTAGSSLVMGATAILALPGRFRMFFSGISDDGERSL